MWLLNTTTLALHYFITPDGICYAILSHTWGDEELSFQDMMMMESDSQAISLADRIYAWGGPSIPWTSQKKNLKLRKGYKKVQRFCAESLAHGYKWAWVDTVCIDKKSSAELSEAINSMYDWYGQSAVCFAYMSDVSMTGKHLDATAIRELTSSRWFTRGWTLQELLAPSVIVFYDKDWRCLGGKAELATHISSAAGIDKRYLRSRIQCLNASIATRMSWASHRSTTRLEDQAYCLLGLFQINMSLLYGEGSRAFTRLQHEIVRHSDDESIFAWHSEHVFSDIFARAPSAFAGCGEYFLYEEPKFPRTPYTMTNRGLSLDTVRRVTSDDCHVRLGTHSLSKCTLVPLNCTSKGWQGRPFAILLQRLSQDVYTRYLAGEVVDYDMYCKKQFVHTDRTTMYIRYPADSFWYESRHTEWSKFNDQFAGKLYEGLVNFDLHSLACHDTDEWFVTPPGSIRGPDRVGVGDWKLRLSGWSGFAVLALKDLHQNPFRITITYGRTETFATAFTLDLWDSHVTIAEVIRQSSERFQERKSALSVSSEHTLPIDEGRVIALKQGPIDNAECCYNLTLKSV